MKQLYLDCSMGAAGDMLAAALYELCPDKQETLAELNGLGIPGIVYEARPAAKLGISGTHMSVRFHGREEGQEQHPREHEHHHGMEDISRLIDSLPLSQNVRDDAKAVYGLIAGAEAKVHGQEMKNIHFHELGTMDAVADVTAVCYLMDKLGAERVTASPVRTGFGTVNCAHGQLPVPAPATALLLEGVPVFPGDIESEMCTPTGAALLKYFAVDFGPMPPMTISRLGYGMGKKDFQRANCVRAVLGDSGDEVIELCCNVDDMSPEHVGYAIDRLLEAGALDAYYEAIGMKKNRPGLLLSCLCRPEQRNEMLRLMFRHTSTIGIRESLCRRYVLRRGTEIVETPYGNVRIKCSAGYGVERKKAEYDDLAKICHDHDLSIGELTRQIEEDCK